MLFHKTEKMQKTIVQRSLRVLRVKKFSKTNSVKPNFLNMTVRGPKIMIATLQAVKVKRVDKIVNLKKIWRL